MTNYSKQSDGKHQALVQFSQSLSESDFHDQLAFHAVQVGIDGHQRFIFDGKWHYADAIEKSHKGKVKYVAEWRTSRNGLRYPTASFFSYRHGGDKVYYNGYNDVVDLFQGNYTPAPAPTKPKPEPSDDEPNYKRNRQRLIGIWKGSYPLDHAKAAPAREYLRFRGLGALLDADDLPKKVLRCHPRLPYFEKGEDSNYKVISSHPAIIAAVQASDDTAVCLRRIYLQDNGAGKAAVQSPKKILPPTRPNGSRGAATRLYPADEKLAVAEGIETALAIRVATGLPVWAAGDCYGLEHLIIPDCVKELLVCADHDSHGKGERAAHRLAARVARQGVVVKVAAPAKAGNDWLDVLIADFRERKLK